MSSHTPPSEQLVGPPSSEPGHHDVFELTREQLDELRFGVVTLDRQGLILRYNRAEANLAARSAAATVGLRFFSDVAPCTDVKAFRGRFEAFAQGVDSGVEIFDFSFMFDWGRHDASITLLRKAGHDEINILVRERSASPRTLAVGGRSEAELRAALDGGEFALHYQPIVDTARDRIIAVESLARWNHPTRGVVAPAEFIELVEQTDFVVAFGEWALREACRQGREWCELGLDIRVCVNVSALQFRQANFVSHVAAILERSGLAPNRLEIELTESVMVDGFGEMVERLSRLKSMGIRLAIDDFGTGYSSLAYLKYFPVDTLKIDRAFVTDIAADSFDRAIAKTVLTLANELGLDCIVEGVESIEQYDVLRAIGCTIMQGYYFGKPMPPAQLIALLRGAAPSVAAPVNWR